ncbi:MAG: hypothetical protein ACLUQ2_00330, partial [Klebsiella pneumoniae]
IWRGLQARQKARQYLSQCLVLACILTSGVMTVLFSPIEYSGGGLYWISGDPVVTVGAFGRLAGKWTKKASSAAGLS